MQDAGVNYEEVVDIPLEHIGEIDDDFKTFETCNF